MHIGEVIRKYRKDQNMTQEGMAVRLGVTAPAVNKWEKGNSLPDITLLSPIARLLDISLDELLSHKQALSEEEANRLLMEAEEKLKTEGIDDVFEWMKACLSTYPNSYYLILWMASIFDSHRQMDKVQEAERYDDYVLNCYTRVLESESETLRLAAAEALYYFYIQKQAYNQAEEYLAYFSKENPERKQKQAFIYRKTGREEEANQMFEELLYSGYRSLSMSFQGIYSMALEEGDYKKAQWMVEKTQSLAKLFEFGEYHEVSAGLEIAQLEKNVEKTLYIMERMLTNIESIAGFSKSPLYAHMKFSTPDENYYNEVREGLLEAFRDEETFAYLKDDKRWRELVGYARN